MKKIILWFLIIIISTPVILWVALPYLPYQQYVAAAVKAQIESYGIKVESLEIIEISTKKAAIANFSISSGDLIVSSQKIDVNYDLKYLFRGKLYGGVIAPEVNFSGLPEPLPPIKIGANFLVPLENPSNGTLALNELVIPWAGGEVSTKPVMFALSMDKPIFVTLKLNQVNLSEVLSKISDGGVQGTGRVSGILPIVYYPDGRIDLRPGDATAIETGTITVSPQLLPGDNAQLELTRNALQNFQYTTLQIVVSSDAANKPVLKFTIEGTNPQAFGERPVKLNVSVSGDFLPLIQQSMLAINDIKQLLLIQEKP